MSGPNLQECNKFSEAMDDINVIREFIDWLHETNHEIMTWGGEIHGPSLLNKTIDDLILEYFDIDPIALEKERQQILAEQRSKL